MSVDCVVVAARLLHSRWKMEMGQDGRFVSAPPLTARLSMMDLREANPSTQLHASSP